MQIIKVKQIGVISGYCRIYYQSIHTGRIYCCQEESPGVFKWYSTDRNYGEPEFPITSEVVFKVV
jgi:hypothetical protein